MLQQVGLEGTGPAVVDQQCQAFQADRAAEPFFFIDDERVVLVQRLQVLADLQGVRGLAVMHIERDAVGLELAGCEVTGGVDGIEEVAHVAAGGIVDQLLRRADLDQLAAFHDADAVADAHGFLNVMGDEDDGAPMDLLQLQQHILHFPTF